MGAYIPGMEIPKNCLVCPFHHYYFPPTTFASDEKTVKAVAVCMATRRKVDAENCPIIPVPPHGRLVDADELRKSIRESIDECHKWANEVSDGEMYARVSQALGTFVECSLRIGAAPTIIEAENAPQNSQNCGAEKDGGA